MALPTPDDLSQCEHYVLSAVRTEDRAWTVQDLTGGITDVDQFDDHDVAYALKGLVARGLLVETLAGFRYVEFPD